MNPVPLSSTANSEPEGGRRPTLTAVTHYQRPKEKSTLERLNQIVLHVIVFAIGIPAVAFSNFWDWELLRGMVLPIIATGFFLYLLLFVLLGGYRVFLPASSRTPSRPAAQERT